MKRIFGLILLVLAIAGSVNYVKRMSALGPVKPTGNSAYDAGQKAGRAAVPVVLGGMGLLGLVLLFSTSDSRSLRPPVPVRRTPVQSRPPPGDSSLRGGQDTFASNPALIRLEVGQWLAANPSVFGVSLSLTLVGLIVAFIKLPVGIILMLAAGIFLFREIREAKQKFYMGDVCPGVVLSAQQNLVAVFTDLAAASPVPQPAIKILKQPLNRMTTEAAYDGMRVATAALYNGDVRRPAWQNFSPELINCVVRDPQEIARVLGSIAEEEWQALDACLAQVPVAKPGLYRMPAVGVNAINVAPVSQTPLAPQGGVEWVRPRPWFKTNAGIVVLAIFGAIAGLILLFTVGGAVLTWASRHRGQSRRMGPTTTPARPRMPPNMPTSREPVRSGPYTAGASVEARWAGRWIPGQITSINPGGFSVMVQLQDPRFQHPVLLPTNQIRLK